ncbi:MAG TPA: excinuclease ABC subunit UvrC [Candidatus Omnitrophica bacterium]|nr:excinuclease ABC subunit UvrC [Candidatus Omnitrophota bacterium]
MGLKKEIEKIPSQIGVYIFKDKEGNYLYIGKTENLRKRVASHLETPSPSRKEEILKRKTASIDYLVTSSEVEALILECNLIKEYKPRYNISLKDDKKYPYIKISLGEEFPTIHLTRDLTDKKARYFGPYTNAKAARKTLQLLGKILAFKRCKKKRIDKKACLNYYIGRCVGPCLGRLKKEDYMEIVSEVSMFLEGEVDNLLAHLRRRMEEASEKLHYELAAKLRDQIEAIKKISSPQKVAYLTGANQDFIGYARRGSKTLITLFKVRDGKLLGQEHFPLIERVNSGIEEAIASFLKQYYPLSSPLPDEIVLPITIEEERLFREWFKKGKGKSVKISVPKRGEKHKLLQMASNNAKYKLLEEERSIRNERYACALFQLKQKLNLPVVPLRIEGIDISNIRGKHAVGSVVVFEKGKAKKDEWRKFKIKNVHTIDDYRMMEEVITRRYTRILQEGGELPDLLLLDGGRGQVSIVNKVLIKMGVKNLPIIGLAKGENKIHSSSLSRELPLDTHLPPFRLLAYIREEAHRLAHSYYQGLKKKEVIQSIGEKIPSVGGKLNQEIIRYFGSWERVKGASVEELRKVRGIGMKKAKTIVEYLKRM